MDLQGSPPLDENSKVDACPQLPVGCSGIYPDYYALSIRGIEWAGHSKVHGNSLMGIEVRIVPIQPDFPQV